jgi:hypothetical protein
MPGSVLVSGLMKFVGRLNLMGGGRTGVSNMSRHENKKEPYEILAGIPV